MDPHVSSGQRLHFRTLVHKHTDAFSTTSNLIGHRHDVQHTIRITDSIPIRCRLYRYSQGSWQLIGAQVAEWIRLGIARPSTSEYASPVVIVDQPERPSTPRRLTVNYIELNKKTVRENCPTPHIDDVLDGLVVDMAEFFSLMYVKMAFMTVPIHPDDIH